MDKYYLGIDLGGTTCKFGLFNNKGKLISKWHISSQVEAKNKQKALLDNIVLSIKNHLSEHKLEFKNIKAIGMAVPGIVKKNSIIQEIVNISFNKKINIKNYFQKRFGTKLKVIAENDANVAALGEYFFGAGKNKNPFCHMMFHYFLIKQRKVLSSIIYICCLNLKRILKREIQLINTSLKYALIIRASHPLTLVRDIKN